MDSQMCIAMNNETDEASIPTDKEWTVGIRFKIAVISRDQTGI